jgi:hypothetical protein
LSELGILFSIAFAFLLLPLVLRRAALCPAAGLENLFRILSKDVADTKHAF